MACSTNEIALTTNYAEAKLVGSAISFVLNAVETHITTNNKKVWVGLTVRFKVRVRAYLGLILGPFSSSHCLQLPSPRCGGEGGRRRQIKAVDSNKPRGQLHAQANRPCHERIVTGTNVF